MLKLKGKKYEDAWTLKVNKYKKLYRSEFAELERRIKRKIPKTVITKLNNFMSKNHKPMATRKSSQIVMTEFGKSMPELIGGSADLKGSNLSYYDDMDSFSHSNPFRKIYLLWCQRIWYVSHIKWYLPAWSIKTIRKYFSNIF